MCYIGAPFVDDLHGMPPARAALTATRLILRQPRAPLLRLRKTSTAVRSHSKGAANEEDSRRTRAAAEQLLREYQRGPRPSAAGVAAAAAAFATGAAMDPFSAIKAILPQAAREFGDVRPVDLLASFNALQKWQAKHRRRCLPGSPAMRNDALDCELLTTAYRHVRLATGSYGWMGLLWFWLTDKSASYGFDTLRGLMRAAGAGDGASFALHAGIPQQWIIFESPSALVGVPKFFIVADELSRCLMVVIRGSMSLNDLLTDAMSATVPFAGGGYAHEGMAHAATTIYNATRDILLAELARRPRGWGVTVTGHSLGAGAAVLFTLHLMHTRRQQQAAASQRQRPDDGDPSVPFAGVDVRCVAFAPPPVFTPLTSLPHEDAQSITCWVHADDLVPRLSLHSLKELIALLRRISQAHPSLTSRLLATSDATQAAGEVVTSHPGWAAALTAACDTGVVRSSNRSNSSSGKSSNGSGKAPEASLPGLSTLSGTAAAASAAVQKGADVIAGGTAGLKGSGSSVGSSAQAQSLTSGTSVADDSVAIDLSEAEEAEAAASKSSSSSTRSDNHDGRFQIPGVIYCYRAPVEEVSTREGMTDASRSGGGNGPASLSSPSSSPLSALGMPSPTAAAGRLLSMATSPVRALWSGITATVSGGGTSGSSSGSADSSSAFVTGQGHVRTQSGATAPVTTNPLSSSSFSSSFSTGATAPPAQEQQQQAQSSRSGSGGSLSGLLGLASSAAMGVGSIVTSVWTVVTSALSPPPTTAAAMERQRQHQQQEDQAQHVSSLDGKAQRFSFSEKAGNNGPITVDTTLPPRDHLSAHSDSESSSTSYGSHGNSSSNQPSATHGNRSDNNSNLAAGSQFASKRYDNCNDIEAGGDRSSNSAYGTSHTGRSRGDSRLDDGVSLPAGIAAVARTRAESDVSNPLVTMASSRDFHSLIIADSAYRDHVPDRYLLTLRQLAEVAQRQKDDRLSRRGAPPSAIGQQPCATRPNAAVGMTVAAGRTQSHAKAGKQAGPASTVACKSSASSSSAPMGAFRPSSASLSLPSTASLYPQFGGSITRRGSSQGLASLAASSLPASLTPPRRSSSLLGLSSAAACGASRPALVLPAGSASGSGMMVSWGSGSRPPLPLVMSPLVEGPPSADADVTGHAPPPAAAAGGNVAALYFYPAPPLPAPRPLAGHIVHAAVPQLPRSPGRHSQVPAS